MRPIYLENEPTNFNRVAKRISTHFRVRFRASRAAAAAPRYQQVFGYGEVQWAGEPKRLLDFYEANHTDFHLET